MDETQEHPQEQLEDMTKLSALVDLTAKTDELELALKQLEAMDCKFPVLKYYIQEQVDSIAWTLYATVPTASVSLVREVFPESEDNYLNNEINQLEALAAKDPVEAIVINKYLASLGAEDEERLEIATYNCAIVVRSEEALKDAINKIMNLFFSRKIWDVDIQSGINPSGRPPHIRKRKSC